MHCGNVNARNKMIYFPQYKKNVISGDTVTVFVHNVKSLQRHVDDVVSDHRIINNDI